MTVAAFFDVDGTLVRATTVHYYLFFMRRVFSKRKACKLMRELSLYLKIPYWMILDQIDRELFDRSFYASFKKLPTQETMALAKSCFDDLIRGRLLGVVVEKVRWHRERGDQVILLSGSPDFVLKPLSDYLEADALLCSALEVSGGCFTGKLAGDPVVGLVKVRKALQYAKDHYVDLSRSYVYADGSSDIPVLKTVGNPVAVCPNFCLRRAAKKNGWPILFDGSR